MAQIALVTGTSSGMGLHTAVELTMTQAALGTLGFVFLMIGAEPNTDWLRASGLKLDARGFVCTGADAGEDRLTGDDVGRPALPGQRPAAGLVADVVGVGARDVEVAIRADHVAIARGCI